jgi:osmoprotectant transport system ATP-binding protein
MVVSLQHITHYYGKQASLHDVSIEFPEKKITAIIGRSGSGKSTLIQLINGLIRPTQGGVLLNGKSLDYTQIFENRLLMGYVVQATGLFPHLTVYQNIIIAGKIKSISFNSEIRAKELMEKVSLPATFKSKYPHELSGGEQQRVGICRALFLNPPILLMDEPFGALDPVTRYEIQEEILRLQLQEPRTILFVTHDMREAAKLADNILVLEKGVVQQYDEKGKVIQHAANGFVKQLIQASLT